MYLYSKHIYLENQKVEGFLEIEDGKIKAIKDAVEGSFINYQDFKIIPGFIDIHVHGFATGSFWYEKTVSSVLEMSKSMVKEGVTSFLATTGADAIADLRTCIEVAEQAKAKQTGEGAEVLGVHLEGPFINSQYKGMQKEENCINPSIKKMEELYQAASAEGFIKLMTMAPELPGAKEVLCFCKEKGIQVSIGHSAATYQDILNVKDYGIGGVTHMYSGMKGLHHRELGVAGTALYLEELYCEFAKQTGRTVAHEVFDLTYQIKGSDRIILSTDCTGLAQVQNPMYHYIRQETFERQGDYLLIKNDDGNQRLINPKCYEDVKELELGYLGSVKNMLAHTRMSIFDLIKITSINPAKYIGMYHQKGSIAPGKDGDLLVIDDNFNVAAVYCKGNHQL